MVFNKIKEFVAPVDEDEDEGEELQFTGREAVSYTHLNRYINARGHAG